MFEIKDNVLVKYNGSEGFVRVPEGVEVIGENAFARKDMIESIILPEGVKKIKECILLLQLTHERGASGQH